MMTDN